MKRGDLPTACRLSGTETEGRKELLSSLFEPENGPISLRVTGPEGAKEFVEAELMTTG